MPHAAWPALTSQHHFTPSVAEVYSKPELAHRTTTTASAASLRPPHRPSGTRHKRAERPPPPPLEDAGCVRLDMRESMREKMAWWPLTRSEALAATAAPRAAAPSVPAASAATALARTLARCLTICDMRTTSSSLAGEKGGRPGGVEGSDRDAEKRDRPGAEGLGTEPCARASCCNHRPHRSASRLVRMARFESHSP